MTKIKATVPQARTLYNFTPNITFNHYDDLGGKLLCGYEKDMAYSVREGNIGLAKKVQEWLAKDALDEDRNVIPIDPEDDTKGNLKLVRLGV